MFVAFLLCEVALRVVALVSPRIAYELQPPWSNRALQPDPILGYRVSPYYPSSDSRGYRNPTTLEQADILAVGDSMTYGYSVLPDNAWPSALQTLTSETVYNAGVGGYGPCEYQNVVKELSILSPKNIVVTLYLGNDMSDSYNSVYLEDKCHDLKTDDKSVLGEMDRLRQEQTLQKQASELGLRSIPEPFRDEIPLSHTYQLTLKDSSAVFSLTRNLYFQLKQFHYSRFGERANVSYETSIETISGSVPYSEIEEIRTVFKNPNVEILAVNQSDLRIAEGRMVTERALRIIKNEANKLSANMLVVLIPTKSAAYHDVLSSAYKSEHQTFVAKHESEQRLKADLVEFLDAEDINYVDTTSVFSASLLDRVPPFHESSNEHPNEHGYALIGKTVVGALSKNKKEN